MKKLLPLVAVFLLGGCATQGPSSIGESNGRVVLANSYIGESYDEVIPRATANYSVEPECTLRKVSLSKQRKTFQYEVCGFTPKHSKSTETALEEVRYHFISGDLVKVDIRTAGDASAKVHPVLLNLVDETMVEKAPWLATE